MIRLSLSDAISMNLKDFFNKNSKLADLFEIKPQRHINTEA